MSNLVQHLKNQFNGEQSIIEKEQLKAVLTAEGFMEHMIRDNRFLSKTETAKIGFKDGNLKLRAFELKASGKDSRSKLEEIAELVSMTVQKLAEEYRKMYVRQCIRLEKKRAEKLDNLITFNKGVKDGNVGLFTISLFGLLDFNIATVFDPKTGNAVIAFGFGDPSKMLMKMQDKEVIEKINGKIRENNKEVRKQQRLDVKKDEMTMEF